MSSADRPGHPEHPDLEAERQHLDLASGFLARMVERTSHALAADASAHEVDAAAARAVLAHRLASLRATSAPFFGRIDVDGPATDGVDAAERHYIGRRHIDDASGEPVVVDWRAPVAVPFYRATFADPLDVSLRRRHVIDGGALVGLFDERLDNPDGAEAGGVPDPLLIELERSRTGTMRDIVATIQAEQDEVIRAGLDLPVIVQGGPGTGKTAVGLHRAAWLLFHERELFRREPMLVVGPNPLFLRYVSEVLPSLGETSVVQVTLGDLVPGQLRVRAVDEPAVAALKGDARMAEVVRRVAFDRLRPPDDELALPLGRHVLRLPAGRLVELVAELVAAGAPLATGREALRRRLVDELVADRVSRGISRAEASNLADQARNDRAVRAVVDRAWPAQSAPSLVRRLLSSRAARDAAGRGLFDGELAMLHRRAPSGRSPDPWTAADVALLDEAEWVLTGPPRRYGHIVVDEAQDLTPMGLRMIARRAPHGSLTVLGDLAQATSPGATADWQQAAGLLGVPDRARHVELALGYRLPASILDLASRLLPEAAPGVRPSGSVRATGDAPRFIEVDHAAMAGAAADTVVELTTRVATVGVLAAPGIVAALSDALTARGVSHGVGTGIGEADVVVLRAAESKGLEFDACVVVDVGEIHRGVSGARVLYVSLTRAVHELVLLHGPGDLPAALVGTDS